MKVQTLYLEGIIMLQSLDPGSCNKEGSSGDAWIFLGRGNRFCRYNRDGWGVGKGGIGCGGDGRKSAGRDTGVRGNFWGKVET